MRLNETEFRSNLSTLLDTFTVDESTELKQSISTVDRIM